MTLEARFEQKFGCKLAGCLMKVSGDEFWFEVKPFIALIYSEQEAKYMRKHWLTLVKEKFGEEGVLLARMVNAKYSPAIPDLKESEKLLQNLSDEVYEVEFRQHQDRIGQLEQNLDL